jgi:hypothetical protein
MKFVFTSDDVGSARGKQPITWFEGVTEWLDGRDIPGTFFWVPKPSGRLGTEQAEWLASIERARAGGHDFQLHGLVHHCLEFGLPNESIRKHVPRIFKEYEANRAKYEAEHSLAEQRRKFTEGVDLYRRVFGEPPLVFRAPCFSIGPNAYQAMYEAGIRYSASRSINPAATGFMMTRNPELEPWQPDLDGRPFVVPPGVTEIPCIEDIVIGGIEPDDYDLALRMFKREVTNTITALGDAEFGVFLSHYNRVGLQLDLIPRLYDELFDWMANAHGITEWVTFRDVLDQ